MTCLSRISTLVGPALVLALSAMAQATAAAAPPPNPKAHPVQGAGRLSLALSPAPAARSKPRPPKVHPVQGSGPGATRLRTAPPVQPPQPIAANPAPPSITVAAPVNTTAVAAPPVAPNMQPTALSPAPTSTPSTAALTNTSANDTLSEVLPSRQVLTASMTRSGLEPTPGSAADLETRWDRSAPAEACVEVVLTPAAGRPDTTWVDLTGDGLIVSAVDSAHVAAVLARAGELPELGAHCLPRASTKALLRSTHRPGSSGSMKLVKLADGWRLMAPKQRAATKVSKRSQASAKKLARTNSTPLMAMR